MDFSVWLAFFAASWVIAISPGSGAVLSMSHGLAYGVRQASLTIVGLQLGLSVILLIAGVGVGALLLASATAFTVVKVVGAAYLLYLGVKQWRAPVDGPAPASGESLVKHPGLPTARERRHALRVGDRLREHPPHRQRSEGTERLEHTSSGQPHWTLLVTNESLCA